MKIASLFVVLLASLLLVACGGNDANTAGTNSGNGAKACGGEKPAEKPTPEKLRQDVADKILKCYTDLSTVGLLDLFKADEQDKAKSRMINEIDDVKAKKGTVKVTESKIETRESKYYLVATLEFTIDGKTESKTRESQLIEHEGKWYLSFQR